MAIESVHSAFLQDWTFAAPGAGIALKLNDDTDFIGTLLANHHGCYLYLYDSRYEAPFWLWDGAKRLRPLEGLEQDIARALQMGEKDQATEQVNALWCSEIAQWLQTPWPETVLPDHWLLQALPLADMWLALVHRVAEEHRCRTEHDFACPQLFPIPMPGLGRFVLRAVHRQALIGQMDIEIDLGEIGNENYSFYRKRADVPDNLIGIHPATWSDSHPVMRMLELAYMNYTEATAFLDRDDAEDFLADAFAPLIQSEVAEKTKRNKPAWLLLFAALLVKDGRETIPPDEVKELLELTCAAAEVTGII
jgi:hypothetical protein